MSYPKNAATPPRIAVGAVVQISDGAVQTSGVSIRLVPQGGSAAAGLGTTSYEDGVVLYAPTQAETNYEAFCVIAYKTGCIPAATTVVTSDTATAGRVRLSGETHSGATIPTVTTITNAVTAGTVSDKTGYSLASNGLASVTAWTVAITGNITGNLSGSVGSVTGAVGSVTSGVTVTTNNDKTGYSLTQAFPTNFASLGINASGHISRVVLVDTCTTNTDMRGTDNAALASVWTSTVAGRIDAAISSRSSHSAADVWSVATRTLTAFSFSVTVGTNNDKTGYSLATAPLDASGTAAAVWGALLASYTTADTFGARVVRSTNSNNSVAITGANHVAADIHELQPAVITAADFAAGAIDANALAADAASEIASAVRTNLATELARIDVASSTLASQSSVNTLTTYVDTEVAAIKAKTDALPANPAATSDIPSATAIADAVLDELLSGHTIPGSVGTALAAASSAGDPWSTLLPGSYPSGSAGAIIGAVLAAIDAVPTAAEIDAVLTAAHGSGSWVGAGSTSSGGDTSGLSSEILAAAGGPSEVQNGDQKVKARSIAELIEADKHLAAKTAAADPGSIFRRITPPGAR